MKRAMWKPESHAAGKQATRRCVLCGQIGKPDRMRECCGLFYCLPCFECSEVQDDSRNVHEVHS